MAHLFRLCTVDIDSTSTGIARVDSDRMGLVGLPRERAETESIARSLFAEPDPMDPSGL